MRRRTYQLVHRPNSPNWYIRIYEVGLGKRTYVSTYTSRKDAAQQMLLAMQLEHATHPYLRGPVPISLNDAKAAYLKEHRSRIREKTFTGLQHSLNLLAKGFGARLMQDISRKDIEEWLTRQRTVYAEATANLYLRHIKQFLNWALHAGHLQTSPATAIKPFPTTKQSPRVLSPTEESALLSHCDPVLRDFVVVAVETGLRRRALLSMTWKHVDLEGGWLNLPGELLKSRRDLQVPLSDRAIAVLRGLRTSVSGRVFPVDASTLGRKWHRARKRAGVSYCKPHDLRRTFLTRCRQRGVPLEVAMSISDHTDLKTVLACYRAIGQDELLGAVGRGGVKPQSSNPEGGGR